MNKLVNNLVYRFSSKVFVVSNEIREMLQSTLRMNNNKIVLLKNGIVAQNDQRISFKLEKEILNSKDKLKILAVGRLVPSKSFDVLIRAISDIVSMGKESVYLLIAGDGERASKSGSAHL